MGVQKRVVLVHGILSRGPWFDKVIQVLGGNFHCIPVSYWQFRFPWVLSLFLYPIALLAVAGGGIAVLFTGPPEPMPLAIAVVSVSFVPIAYHLLRWGAAKRIRTVIGNHCGDARPPHVIAHSMGTSLVLKVLRKSKTQRFDRMILVGCVLPRRYRWPRLADKVSQVRNEKGTWDAVAFVAAFVPGLGQAGQGGFSGRAEDVHSVENPLDACPHCVPIALAKRPRLHNVALKDYGHTEVFLERRHCLDLWLPALWGFPPNEYKRYVLLSTELAELVQNKAWAAAEEKCRELRSLSWTWTRTRFIDWTLGDFIEETMRRYGRRIGQTIPVVSDTVDWVIQVASSELARAIGQLDTPIQARDATLARKLWPDTAIGSAVEEILS